MGINFVIIMTKIFTKVNILFIIVLWAYPALADVAEAVRNFANGGSVKPDYVSVMIADLSTSEILGEWNGNKSMIPASVMKCVTTATLLEKADKDWRYETVVYTDGPINSGILEGNLIIRGSADPSLGTVHEPGSKDMIEEIVQALQINGVKTIEGNIIIDEKDFAGPAIPSEWAKGDLPHAYGTGTHGFNYQDNASGSKSVADPAGLFTARLRGALSRAGIAVNRNTYTNQHKKVLGTHRSEPLSDIMRSCMMRSDNQFAEGMLRTIGKLAGKDGSTASGAKTVMDYWHHKGLPMEGVNIYDGSGLSRTNRLTARFLGGVLEKMAGNPYYASFFPLAGQEGTLRKFLVGSNLEGMVAMKTGSMRGVQCYAGYKLDEDYVPTHVIVVMINEMGNRDAARAGVRKMLEEAFPE